MDDEDKKDNSRSDSEEAERDLEEAYWPGDADKDPLASRPESEEADRYVAKKAYWPDDAEEDPLYPKKPKGEDDDK